MESCAIPYKMNVLKNFLSLELPEDVQFLEYVWIDGSGEYTRSKRMEIKGPTPALKDLTIWNYDGSSTGQAEGHDSEVLLKPVAIYRDPFMRGDHKMVMCEALDPAGNPVRGNKRTACAQTIAKIVDEHEPWFAMEQEWVLLDGTTCKPVGWPVNGYPEPQGPYYCGAGGGRENGRDVAMAHYNACRYAGIQMSGLNGEVLPGQWEFQCGPSVGIKMADDLWMARYLLNRVAAMFGYKVTLDPKPVPGDWNGSGAHMNFSTKSTRAANGITVIEKYIERLKQNHQKHIQVYDPKGGLDNQRRLTGEHETASINTFSSGIAARNASIRIPRKVASSGCGYMEDRRPSSNADPYSVIDALMKTCVLQSWE
ncbi:glutamine synthetase 2 [Brevipalpus obovatus]|uniref:glutamine synthetase 2 n=1 Tax=Brevipalpus obovatus TaxID=246614 RepID=UPI003D9E9D48